MEILDINLRKVFFSKIFTFPSSDGFSKILPKGFAKQETAAYF
jgi:hypothetical protein